ncbi:MAG: hypothetical protein JO208_00040 [Alphaproteobacteria bacterium]|nr:hypothetical protein [Alphaproteobacteria bacterium]
MLSRMFPRAFDNTYRGHWLGLVLFVLIIAVKALQGFNSMIRTHQIMTGADGIPVDSFSPVAAAEATQMFALLGMYLLVLPLIGVAALVRYRAMVPFLLLMLIAVQLGARGVHLLHPTLQESTGCAAPIGFYINMGILGLTLLAFVLSLVRHRSAEREG